MVEAIAVFKARLYETRASNWLAMVSPTKVASNSGRLISNILI